MKSCRERSDAVTNGNGGGCPCPEGLSPRSAEFWNVVAPRLAKSPGRRVLLEQALRLVDRADELHALLAQQGPVTVTERSGLAHINPLVRAEREARGTAAKIMALLHLNWDADVDGRAR